MKRRLRTVAAIAALLWAVIGSSSDPARAQSASIGIDPRSGPPLTTIKVTGQGFCGSPCSPVSIVVDNLHVDDNVAVGADGGFTTFVQVPGGVGSGPIPVIASQTDGQGNDQSARTTFDVTPSQPASVNYPPPSSTQPPSGSPAQATATTTPSTGEPSTSTTAPTTSSTSTSTSSPSSSSASSSDVAAAPPASSSSSSGPGAGLVIALVVLIAVAASLATLWVMRRRRESA